ncbi:MAG: class I SAM-dependent methyltransferase [Acidobacteriota bacterium]
MMQCPVCSCHDCELFTTAFDRVLDRPEETWEIRRCHGCGFGWTTPLLTEEEIKRHYPPTYLGDTARTVDEFLSGKLQRSRSWRKETEKVDLVERFVAGGRILDVGCGDGKFLWALDPRKWDKTGVELAQQTIRLVGERIQDLTLIEGNIFSDQLIEGSFNVITFWHVLEHLPQPGEVLKRVHQLLCPGGWIFISLPNLDSLQARLFRRYWYVFDDVPRHLYHFAPQPLEMLLGEKGLRVCKHLFFSPIVNIHCLKYSLINWTEAHFGSRLPYYILKPLLMAFPLVERLSGKYGMLTTIARRGD